MSNVRILSLVTIVVLVSAPTWGVGASSFEVRSADEVKKGTLDDVIADELGRLTLAYDKVELLKEDGEIFWSLAVTPAGDVYAGTSHKGRIHVIRGGKPSVAWTVPDAAVFAVAIGPDGAVYAGGSPGGNIYRNGVAFSKTGESYIWALVFDKLGRLHAATGPDGKLLRIDAAGKATVVLDSSDAHLMSLVVDKDGVIYAASSDKGLVYKVAPDGTSTVIYDAAESEIRALALDDAGNLYLGTADVKPGAARSGGPVGMRSVSPPPATSSDDEKKSSGPSVPEPAPEPIRDDVSATNAIYRIAPDGSVVELYKVRGKMILSLLWTGGSLYAGTGNRGDLVRIDRNLDVTVLEKDLERQVLTLADGRAGAILMGTGYQGRVLRYGAGYVKEGLYTSEVFDAKFVAKFGAVTWKGVVPAGTSVEVTTQTGNVAEPDASWSDWSVPYATSGARLANPPGRFLRYRLKLKTGVPGTTPEIDGVRVAYLTSNQPPRVKSVDATTPADRMRKSGKPGDVGKVEIAWQAEDPNGDDLKCRVEFRARGDVNWRVLEEETTKTSYTWSTEAVGDGDYEVRVVASDAPENPADVALTHAKVSQPFTVDNVRPQVDVTVRPGAIGAAQATANVALGDRTSIIRSAEYALDSGKWQRVNPSDGIFDANAETVTIELTGLAAGEHTIAVRATDESGNTGAASRTFSVK